VIIIIGNDQIKITLQEFFSVGLYNIMYYVDLGKIGSDEQFDYSVHSLYIISN
jgi:hypothetical protein